MYENIHLGWIPPRRIRDNMTPLERKGMEIVKKDTEHIYRMEDKGSSIVKIKKEDCINNATKN